MSLSRLFLLASILKNTKENNGEHYAYNFLFRLYSIQQLQKNYHKEKKKIGNSAVKHCC